MPIATQFDHGRDDGFVRSYDLRAARRQFQVSLILILVMAGAAIALGFMTRFDQADALSRPATLRSGLSGGAET